MPDHPTDAARAPAPDSAFEGEPVLHLAQAEGDGAVVALKRPARDSVDGRILGLLLLIAIATIGGIGALAWRLFLAPDAVGAGADRARLSVAVPPPKVEPVEYLPITREDARAINAAKPFSTAPNPPATPLFLKLAAADDARAVDCLAAAEWYEAGDDAVGEQAVAQVVLNRLRHPSFPKTVCGVVFQGAERTTGCQFSFSCDGSMRRTPSAVAWRRARDLATAALHGFVFRAVGWATHYHTDWVVPNWNEGVEKVAMVRTHLFFRWPGGAGRPAAFRGRHEGSEPLVPLLGRLSPAHREGGSEGDGTVKPPTILIPGAAPADAADATAPAPDAATLRGNTLQRSDAAANLHVITIKPDQFAGTLALVALDICKSSPRACTVVGFLGTPGRVTTGAAGQPLWPDRPPDFYYFSDRSRGRETKYWNCAAMPRANAGECMPAGFAPQG